MSFVIQLLIRLRNMITIFFICRHINNFIRNTRILRIRFVHLPVRSLNKSIFIDSCIRCQRVNQSDVRSFRRLNRTHSSVMGIVYVTDLESGTVTGQTTRSQSRQTTFVSQLRQRVVLIHELRQLGTSKKLFHSSCHRLNINQGLSGNPLNILRCHSFAYHTLHTGQTDTILVLKQFTNGANASVTQMIDIIVISKSVLQMHVIVDGSKNIFFGNMFRNQQRNTSADCLIAFFRFVILLQNFLQFRIVNFLGNTKFFLVRVRKKTI